MIPEGMHDVLPPEAAELRALEENVRGRFAAYGYDEVRTPLLEFAETFEEAGDAVLDVGLRLSDAGGTVLMLRDDLTVPVARLVATRLRDRRLPLRLCYVADGIRAVAPHRGEEGQFTQAGVELFGLDGPEADAELVVMLCDTLAACGLKGSRVTIGSVAFHRELVAALGLDDDQSEDLFGALAARDYPLLESIVANAGVDADGLQALQIALELGGGEGALAEARKLATTDGMESVLERLVEVRDLVDEAGFGDAVGFDFGLFQDLDYYSGLLIEAYAPGVGFPVATGGRYDGLTAKFGWDLPGAGFAISMDRLNVALADQGVGALAAAGRTVSFIGGLDEIERATELRRAGLAVAALPVEYGDAPPPSLRRGDGEWVVATPEGRVVRGSWRDALRALGAV